MREQRFEYRLPKTTALLGVVIGLALAIGGVLAIVKDWGLSVFGAVPLDSEYVWVVFAALVAIGVPLAIAWFDPLAMPPVFKGLLIGNAVAALLAGMLLLYAARQSMGRDPRDPAARQQQ